MVSFPQEIPERIALHSDNETRLSLLTVSRRTQAAVEKAAWNGSYELRNSNTDTFLNLYHGHRIALLRRVNFALEFPELRGKVEEYMDTQIQAMKKTKTTMRMLRAAKPRKSFKPTMSFSPAKSWSCLPLSRL